MAFPAGSGGRAPALDGRRELGGCSRAPHSQERHHGERHHLTTDETDSHAEIRGTADRNRYHRGREESGTPGLPETHRAALGDQHL